MNKIDNQQARKIMFEYLRFCEEKLNPRYTLEKRQTPELLEPKEKYNYISLALCAYPKEEEDYFVFHFLYFKHTPDGLEECIMAGSLTRILDKETGAIIKFNSVFEDFNNLPQYLKDLKSSGKLSEVAHYLPFK